jgi:RNA 2',3'-cyclic 3'-phosphodiesterase
LSFRDQTVRLFFALWPPSEVAEQLAAIARDVAQRFGGKPTRQETLHLTLAFLGEVPDEALGPLTQMARRIAGAAFTLKLDRLGYWPRKELLWAGESATSVALAELAAALRQALREAEIAVADRGQPFAPHITLLRRLSENQPAPAAIETIRWPCSSFGLIRSRRSDAGSVYEVLGEFPLGGSPDA